MRCLVVLLAAAALAAPVGSAADPSYAGLTRPQAVEKAKLALLSLTLAFRGVKAAEKIRAQLDRMAPPRTARSSCKGRPAWRVRWPQTTPVFASRRWAEVPCGGYRIP